MLIMFLHSSHTFFLQLSYLPLLQCLATSIGHLLCITGQVSDSYSGIESIDKAVMEVKD